MSLKLTLPALTAMKGAAVKVPIAVTDFNNIGSTSLMIGFNPKVLKFTGITGQPKSNFFFTDAVTANRNSEVRIAWFDMVALNIGTGVYCTLHFTYKGGACPITFNHKEILSTVTDALGNNLVAELIDGTISAK